MIYKIPEHEWEAPLAVAIEAASPGDKIVTEDYIQLRVAREVLKLRRPYSIDIELLTREQYEQGKQEES